MKPIAVALAVSLALNALFVAGLVRRSATRIKAEAKWIDPPAASQPTITATTAKAVLALEPGAMRTALHHAGLPPEAADALVKARIFAAHDTRRQQLVHQLAQLPWWKTRAISLGGMSLFSAEQRKELRDLQAAAHSEILRVLGPESLDRDGAIAARFSFVDPKRAVQLDAMLRDYQDLGAMLREEMHGLRTRADRERETFLETERQRDLAQFLSAPEREILEMRTSPAASAMQPRLATFEPTEQEYRALFGIFREFHAEHPGSVTVDGQSRPGYYREYPEVDDRIRATLGEARYADWSLAGHAYTQALVRMAPELGLTFAMIRESAGMLRDTAARSWSIGEDRTTTHEQKVAELKTLAANARSTLEAQLGPIASAALLRETPWLGSIANGYSVRVDGARTSWLPVGSVQRAAPERRIQRAPVGGPPSTSNPGR